MGNNKLIEYLSSDEQQWFSALTAKRRNAVNVLKDEGLINIFVTHIVDTYRESAHFIYELIQNADDVQATKARFQLQKGGLFFSHNGLTKFSITNPESERQNGVTPGHINAITTFSLSTKKDEIENKIGKFGIGFKSVFQYTNTPHIYNSEFNFRIEEFMIPILNDYVFCQLKDDETTAFWLPFDKLEKTPEEAFAEISDKMGNFHNPLLFLRNLVNIEIQIESEIKIFEKSLSEIVSHELSDTRVFKIKLDGDEIIRFDRNVIVSDKIDNKYCLPINIAFVVDEKGNISADEKYKHYFQNAWCFFPTYQPTKLNYIINAPFILTPNREALKESRIENNQLLNGLKDLAAMSIQGLKTLGFINETFYTTIPIPKTIPSGFQEIGQSIINKILAGEFIPTFEGDHISVKNAFMCTEELLAELLSYDNYCPLRRLTGIQDARIVFRNRKLFNDAGLFVFVYQNLSSAKSDLQSTWLGGQYKKEFLEDMPEEFDILFFNFLAEKASSILGKDQPLWRKPFVPVEDGTKNYKLVAPIDVKGDTQVYIGGLKKAGRYTVVEYLLKNKDIEVFLLNQLHFIIPDGYDDFILNLDKYIKPDDIPINEIYNDINEILKLLTEVSQVKRDKLIAKLKKLSFLPTISVNGEKKLINPFFNDVYYPTVDLKKYFSKSVNGCKWIDLEFNRNLHSVETIENFCISINVKDTPSYNNTSDILDGLTEYLNSITFLESIYLSNILIVKSTSINFSKNLPLLRTTEWLFDSNAIKKAPNQIKSGDLHEEYSPLFNNIHLSFGALVDPNDERFAKLSVAERLLLEKLTPTIECLTPEEIIEALSDFEAKKKLRTKAKNIDSQIDSVLNSPEDVAKSWITEPLNNINNRIQKEISGGTINNDIPNLIDFWKEQDNLEDKMQDNPGGFSSSPIIGNRYREDQQLKKRGQLEKEIELDSKRNQLIELANNLEPYSFRWFNTLLELEDNFSAENRVRRNPIRVIFSKVELDVDGLLVLSETPFIPVNIEEIGDISIQLFVDDDKRTIKGEVISPKKDTLTVKLSNSDSINNIDISKVTRAIVEASSPDFILEKLKKAFAQLPFEPTDNLRSSNNIPYDINFVFGPPGTGKTTYLSRLIGGKNSEQLNFCGEPVIPLMEQSDIPKKVLVLTPTNKAADVLVECILKNYSKHNAYPDWLIRYGQTINLEKEPIFVGNNSLKPWIYEKCTLVTTIARFPYDRFKVEQDGQTPDQWALKDFNWDYIIFDEASMIHQSAILYVILYTQKLNPKIKFFVGGDPFQIPPIIQFEFPHWSYLPEPAVDNFGYPILDEIGTQVNWKNDGGNIYAFTGLMKEDSFSNPNSEPHNFKIHNLTTQYRSLPAIGALFSQYCYKGQLSHFRNDENIALMPSIKEKPIQIKGLQLKALNIIRFPVNKYQGIFKPKTVNGSPYHIYSAIFSVELIKYIQTNCTIEKTQPYRIGIICPYAIQNTIVTKLLEKSVSGPLEVVTGTVHGFQGDECDLVIAILNPPKNITRSPRSFLNKRNILNVAISRARDKMILLIPYDPENEVNINDLHQIRWIEHLASSLIECKGQVQGFLAKDIERVFWGSDSFIDDNAFSTTHQNVNIYTNAARNYEIRYDENAIDVQVKQLQ